MLDLNGFDTLLALKGIRWEDKNYFFDCLDESVRALVEADDSDELKQKFLIEMANSHYHRLETFKLKMGHKNLIVNLCHELESTNVSEFNAVNIVMPEPKRGLTELVVRKPSEEHEDRRTSKGSPAKRVHEEDQEQPEEEIQEQEEGENSSYVEQEEFLDEQDNYEDSEFVEYQEVKTEDMMEDESYQIYATEQIVAYEADHYEHDEIYYESSPTTNRTGPPRNKKPKHMYTEQFLQTQATQGRIGTPGRRRPKIQKNYPDTDEGMLERWADLVRQSCQVIVPDELLSKHTHQLENIDITKTAESVWDVKCPMCTKKLRLQLTKEGKYYNYKRSNFERHLRIVHYKQIKSFKHGTDEEYDGHSPA